MNGTQVLFVHSLFEGQSDARRHSTQAPTAVEQSRPASLQSLSVVQGPVVELEPPLPPVPSDKDAPSGKEAAVVAQRAGLEPLRVVEAVSSGKE